MYYYIAKINDDGKIERSSCPFLFINKDSKCGQLVRSTMFSFYGKLNELMQMMLIICEKRETILEKIKFNFISNTDIQKINDKYSIQFQKENNVYFCPTLFI